jgi:hypothetical protein
MKGTEFPNHDPRGNRSHVITITSRAAAAYRATTLLWCGIAKPIFVIKGIGLRVRADEFAPP